MSIFFSSLSVGFAFSLSLRVTTFQPLKLWELGITQTNACTHFISFFIYLFIECFIQLFSLFFLFYFSSCSVFSSSWASEVCTWCQKSTSWTFHYAICLPSPTCAMCKLKNWFAYNFCLPNAEEHQAIFFFFNFPYSHLKFSPEIHGCTKKKILVVDADIWIGVVRKTVNDSWIKKCGEITKYTLLMA